MSETFQMLHLKNGETIVVTQLRYDQYLDFHEFLNSLDDETKLYLKYDITSLDHVKERLSGIERGTRITVVARNEAKKIVGSATVYWTAFGWKAHVGKLRVIVHPNYRRQGLARTLASLVFMLASKQNLRIISAEFRVDDAVSRRLLKGLGFKEEAVLKRHVQDNAGVKHDLQVMSANLQELMDRYGLFSESPK